MMFNVKIVKILSCIKLTLMKNILPLIIGTAAILASATPSKALTFNVNQSWTGSFAGNGNVATLTGTVDIPVGNYTRNNGNQSSPFTGVNLTLNINGVSDALNASSLNIVNTLASYFINVSSADIKISTSGASGAGSNYLLFTSTSTSSRVLFGSDANPAFVFGSLSSGTLAVTDSSFPLTLGTVAPTPTPVPWEGANQSIIFFGASLFIGYKILMRKIAYKSIISN
ncbi:hypothetical protein [Anabaena sp. UHCC 0451]|uniref:hypothetical protein n=1 Tax=Anabaena sp. UHCC 0451 TaxID=2055235 RepID=UPI002B2011BC|nr:hypothetical protein [Anabaena sp. UHCC 0451]MEA5576090.1 hypothetical protein [Anabaena sp. UHCC 0451]